MDVRMVMQVLAPGVEHGDEADLGAEMLWVGADRAERLGRCLEQDGVDRLLVLERDLGDRRRQREHDMEIRRRQQLGLPGRQPFGTRLPLTLRAVPVPAGIVGAAHQSARRADLGVAAQRRRPAQFDGAHHASFDAAKMTVMRPAIGVAVAAEDIRHFQTGRHGGVRSGGRHHLQRQPIERALGSPDEARRDLRIAGCRRQLIVAEQNLDDPDIGAALQEMRREAVPQRVHCHALRNPAAAQAERQAEYSTCTSIGLLSSRP
jgi:hypothetical protein